MKAFQTILSFLLVTIVLMSTIGHSVSFHFCGGEIENFAVYGPAQGCNEKESGCEDNHTINKESFSNKGCCDNKTVVVDTDRYISKTEKVNVVYDYDYSISLLDQVLYNYPLLRVKQNRWVLYKPPLIQRNITILDQTFLI